MEDIETIATHKMKNLLTLNITLYGSSKKGLVQTMQLPYNICWSNLENIIKASFDVQEILLMYIDDDKELINMNSPEELQEAIQVGKKNKNKLDIVVCFPAAMNSSALVREQSEETNEPSVLTLDEETGAVSGAKLEKSKLSISSPVVHHFAAELESDKPHGSLCDSESGETSPSVTKMIKEHSGIASNVSYQSLVQLLEQLKHELKTEIVRDVITKTVQQVMDNASGSQKVSAEAANQTGSQLQEQQCHVLHWHEGVTCDVCKHTIVGVRYKCGNCLDYDLCEQCENQAGIHNANHVFLKLRRPCRLAGMLNESKPLLQYVLYSDVADQLPLQIQQHYLLDYENIPDDLRRHCKYSKTHVKMAKMLNRKKKEEKLLDLQRRHEEKGKRSFKQSRNLPVKKERLDLADPVDNMAAAFVRDVTIPDDTKVLPSTRLVKTWRMKNTGKLAWTDKTVMCLKSGNIYATVNEVAVPLLLPGEEGDVTVHLLAPAKPGKYQSNWTLYYGSQSFGPCVWCSIVVGNDEQAEPTASTKNKEALSKEGSPLPIPTTAVMVSSVDHQQVETKSPPTVKKADDNVDKVLSNAVAGAMAKLSLEPTRTNGHLQQDLLSFEMLNMHDRSIARASHTATPNNTPLDVSPPKSPTPDMDQPTVSSSNSSSVELLPEDTDTENNHFASELAQHIGGMTLKPVSETDADVESLATLSDDDSSSQYDSDFYIVPLPDCFDPTKPILPSVSEGSSQGPCQMDSGSEAPQVDDNHNTIVATTNNSLPHSQACAASVDELMTCTNVSAPPPLHPTLAVADEFGKEVEAASSPSPSRTPHLVSPPSNMAADAAAAGDCVDVLVQRRRQQQQQHHHNHQQQQQDVEAAGAPAESGHFAMPQQPNISRMDINAATSRMDINAATGNYKEVDMLPPSPTDFANQLMTTAVNAASRAAAQAYSTAKDVFFSLQARPLDGNMQQVPYYRQTSTGSSSSSSTATVGVPQRQWPKPHFQHEVRSPMNQLIEMGFANRDINQRLLDKHCNNVEKVVQEILQTEGIMTWPNSRH